MLPGELLLGNVKAGVATAFQLEQSAEFLEMAGEYIAMFTDFNGLTRGDLDEALLELEGAGQRCLVPMTVLGETRAAAGLWGRWTRQGQTRVESFAVLTLEDGNRVYQPLLLEVEAWSGWLAGRPVQIAGVV